MPRPPDLPDFAAPPVVEVVLGVRFEALRGWRQAHVGLVWAALRDRFPTTADQPRLESPLADADDQGPAFELQLLDSPPTLRSWFLSDEGDAVVQLQDDRFLHNWRSRGEAYPRFEQVQAAFWNSFRAFRGVVGDADLDRPRVQEVEVTYVNWVEAQRPGEYLNPLGSPLLDVDVIGPPDVERWIARYPVRDGGVLLIESSPSRRPGHAGSAGGQLLRLSCMIQPEDDASDAHLEALIGRGREVIVRGFAAVTRRKYHAEDKWRRLQ